MPVEGEAHVEEDLRRRARIAQPRDHVQPEGEHRDPREHRHDARERGRIAPEEGGVDQVLAEVGDVEREGGARQAEGEHQDQPLRVGTDEAEGPANLAIDEASESWRDACKQRLERGGQRLEKRGERPATNRRCRWRPPSPAPG